MKKSFTGEEEKHGMMIRTLYLSGITVATLFIMIIMATNVSSEIDDDIDLRINEIMYDPEEENDYNEWIEIYNYGDSNVNLENMTLCGDLFLEGYIDRDGEAHNEEGLVLGEDEYAIITDGGSGTEVYENFDVDNSALAIHVDGSSLCTGLNNNGDTITLESNESTIDEIVYDEGDVEKGYSLEYIDGDFVESLEAGGTPGEENSEQEEEEEETEEEDDSEDEEEEIEEEEAEEETVVDDSDSNQETEENSETNTFQEVIKEKIVLNPISDSLVDEGDENDENEENNGFTSKQEKLRMGVIFAFGFFLVILVVLLAWRKL